MKIQDSITIPACPLRQRQTHTGQYLCLRNAYHARPMDPLTTCPFCRTPGQRKGDATAKQGDVPPTPERPADTAAQTETDGVA
jgi:hypothetical protein